MCLLLIFSRVLIILCICLYKKLFFVKVKIKRFLDVLNWIFVLKIVCILFFIFVFEVVKFVKLWVFIKFLIVFCISLIMIG